MWILIIIAIIIAFLLIVGLNNGKSMSKNYILESGGLKAASQDFINCIEMEFHDYTIRQISETEMEIDVNIGINEHWTFYIRQFKAKKSYRLVSNRPELYKNFSLPIVVNFSGDSEVSVFNFLIVKMNNLKL